MSVIDIEKQPMATITSIPSPLMSPASPNLNRLSTIEQYKTIFGDTDAKPGASNYDSFYQSIVEEERRVTRQFWAAGFLFYSCVAAQIVLCLGIAIGCQLGLSMDTVSILAGVNTGVAATIGVLKGLGLPEKKHTEQVKLRKIAERIRNTTRKIMAGFDIDVSAEFKEITDLRDKFQDEHIASTPADANASPKL